MGFIKYFTDNTNLYYNGTFVTNEGSSALTVVNSTLIGNTVIALPLINSASGSTVKVYNSILWRYGSGLMNTASVNDIITSDNTNPAICDIQNSILFKQDQGNRINSTSGVNPRLRDLSTATGPDGVLFSADDGYIPVIAQLPSIPGITISTSCQLIFCRLAESITGPLTVVPMNYNRVMYHQRYIM